MEMQANNFYSNHSSKEAKDLKEYWNFIDNDIAFRKDDEELSRISSKGRTEHSSSKKIKIVQSKSKELVIPSTIASFENNQGPISSQISIKYQTQKSPLTSRPTDQSKRYAKKLIQQKRVRSNDRPSWETETIYEKSIANTCQAIQKDTDFSFGSYNPGKGSLVKNQRETKANEIKPSKQGEQKAKQMKFIRGKKMHTPIDELMDEEDNESSSSMGKSYDDNIEEYAKTGDIRMTETPSFVDKVNNMDLANAEKELETLREKIKGEKSRKSEINQEHPNIDKSKFQRDIKKKLIMKQVSKVRGQSKNKSADKAPKSSSKKQNQPNINIYIQNYTNIQLDPSQMITIQNVDKDKVIVPAIKVPNSARGAPQQVSTSSQNADDSHLITANFIQILQNKILSSQDMKKSDSLLSRFSRSKVQVQVNTSDPNKQQTHLGKEFATTIAGQGKSSRNQIQKGMQGFQTERSRPKQSPSPNFQTVQGQKSKPVVEPSKPNQIKKSSVLSQSNRSQTHLKSRDSVTTQLMVKEQAKSLISQQRSESRQRGAKQGQDKKSELKRGDSSRSKNSQKGLRQSQKIQSHAYQKKEDQ